MFGAKCSELSVNKETPVTMTTNKNKIDELHSRIVRAAIQLCKLKKDSTGRPHWTINAAELESAKYEYEVPVRSLKAIDPSADVFVENAYRWAEYKVQNGFPIKEKDIQSAITRFTLMD